MFEKNLNDVVKGIRSSKRDTSLYISQVIAECKTELHSTDPFVKANALQKLTFLQMMGYTMSFATFACVEVMSSPRFAHKRIGYLAGCQGFTESDTEIILLTTNLLKKELRNASTVGMNGIYEAGLAINFLANVVTPDLARELLPEMAQLTQHPNPYLRKKAVLCLFKLFVRYPQGLRLTFDRVKSCLSDNEPAVVSCAVNVIAELSDKQNPKNYLLLAPQFFDLLTSSSNNWMLIKVVKLLGSLVGEEPRLARKLLDPLVSIIRNTAAKSLLYEAVYTVTLSLPHVRRADGSVPSSVPGVVSLCASTLRQFVEDPDQNLKYLGLVGFASLMTSHPEVLKTSEHKDLILRCLSDEDVTLRTRALELLAGMATRKNLRELVTQLLRHVDMASGTTYQRELVDKIVFVCRRDKYAYVSDFGWYFRDVLIRLGHVRGDVIEDSHGLVIREQLIDVALRVLPVRTVAVRCSMGVLFERVALRRLGAGAGGGDGGMTASLASEGIGGGGGRGVMREVLPAVAWIVGEYSHLIEGIEEEMDEKKDGVTVPFYDRNDGTSRGLYHAVVRALLLPSWSEELEEWTQAVYVQAAMKVFAAACNSSSVDGTELEACVATLNECLPFFIESTDAEVQERAFSSYRLLHALHLVPVRAAAGGDLSNVFGGGDGRSGSATVIPPDDDEGRKGAGGDDDDDDGSSDGSGSGGSSSGADEESTSGAGGDIATAPSGDLLNLDMLPSPPRRSSSAPPSDEEVVGEPSGAEGEPQPAANPLDDEFLSMAVAPPSEAKPDATKHADGGSGGGLAGRCRAAADTLASLFVPEPMKPVGAKAQKRLAPPASVDLDAPLDTSLFNSLFSDDDAIGLVSAGGVGKKPKVGIEEVSFTSQRLRRVSGVAVSQDAAEGGGGGPHASSVAASSGFPGGSQSLLEMAPVGVPCGAANPVMEGFGGASEPGGGGRYHENHPFYLSSGGGGGAGAGTSMGNVGGGADASSSADAQLKRFGTIQLLDDDEDSFDDGRGGKKKGKSKKKKSAKKKKKGTPKGSEIGEADFAMLSMGGGDGGKSTSADYTVYRSDDDEEEDSPGKTSRRKHKSKESVSGAKRREFAGLAQVDLTAPLGDDEVMPERQHRQVPHKAVGGTSSSKKKHGKGGKKEDRTKQEKKSKRKDRSKSKAPEGGTSNDLLDLGMFDTTASAPKKDAIGSAFDAMTDDLLLPMSSTPKGDGAGETPAVGLGPMQNQDVPDVVDGATSYLPILDLTAASSEPGTNEHGTKTKSSSKRPWLKATVKTSSTDATTVYFKSTAVHYKVYVSSGREEKDKASASLLVKIVNDGTVALQNASVQFTGDSEKYVAGEVPPGGAVELKTKAGPFSYANAGNFGESSEDVRGSIHASGFSAPLKLSLPCVMLLKPVRGLTHDHVMDELGIGSWSSHTVKLSISELEADQVIPVLCGFLRCSLVGDTAGDDTVAGTKVDPLSGTLAARSKQGTHVRALVKVKKNAVKIDIKCSNSNDRLGKTIVSDLKKLVL